MRNKFVAYIPVINRQYLNWLQSKDGPVSIEVVPQYIAEQLLPRLSRNVISLPENIVIKILGDFFPGREVNLFDPRKISSIYTYYFPDEDLSRALVDRYFLGGLKEKAFFEPIAARYDMKAVKMSQPIIPDCVISSEEIDLARIAEAEEFSKQSPDWWRQIGVLFYKEGHLLVRAWNQHYPTEYEPVVFGDPRLNFDAGDINASDIYTSLHAERVAISMCAKRGISTQGISVYINTFPCGDCARWLVEAGISKLYFKEGSSFLKGFETLKTAGVEIVQVKFPEQ